ncbi:MAG: hypothetical protein HYV63_31810 [Candidatus Schekmanbacteria bacterium]|nr:hypothetical protein [Candidatus Schekmanbacteria bacterium]
MSVEMDIDGTVAGPAPRLPRVVLFAAMPRELAILRRACAGVEHVTIARAGIGHRRAAKAVRRYFRACGEAKSTIQAALVLGVAGATSPGLAVGDVVVCDRAMAASAPAAAAIAAPLAAASARLARLVPKSTVRMGSVATADRFVARRGEKLDLGAACGCLAVDMETHAIALECQKLAVPWAAIRVISDDTRRDVVLDPRLLALMGRRFRAGEALEAVTLRQLVPALRLAWNLRVALRVLERVARVIASETELLAR